MKNQQGISLVELMISMTLGLVLTLGILSLFATSQRSYQTLRDLTQMQENAYFAIHFLSEPLREAGFFQGCPVSINVDAPGTIWNNFHRNPVQLGSAGQLIVRGPIISQGAIVTGVAAETVTVSGVPGNLKPNDPVLMIARDCNSAVFSTVQEVGTTTITLASSGLANSILYPLQEQIFEVVDDGNGRSQLVRNRVPLVMDVSSLNVIPINHSSNRDSGVLRADRYSTGFGVSTIGVEIELTMVSESDIDSGNRVERTYIHTIAMRNRQVQ